MENQFMMEDPISDVHLGDLLSPGNRRKITKLMSNLYQPDSLRGWRLLIRTQNIERIILAQNRPQPEN